MPRKDDAAKNLQAETLGPGCQLALLQVLSFETTLFCLLAWHRYLDLTTGFQQQSNVPGIKNHQ
jgi:hypothetical protein